jgi:hypothetical protein
LAAAVTGCSQVAQLQPVAGDGVTSVRIATNDVLLNANVPVKMFPVCTYEGTNYTCNGSTEAGLPIVSEAKTYAAADLPSQYRTPDVKANDSEVQQFIVMQVKVGPKVLYDGPTTVVLRKNGRSAT